VEFSVVIATKDRAEYLGRALESLAAQRDAPAFEVVVVDNGSSDATQAIVAANVPALPAVRYVASPEPNRGKARNAGARAASGRYLLFCDDDVQLPPHWIAAHAAAQARDGACVVNGPIINVASYESRPNPKPSNYSRAFLCTCNASLPRDAFIAVGGFDETFRLYGWEDTELGVRLRSAGLRWKFAWNAYLWHVKPPHENTIAVESRKAVEKARMARLFIAKHASSRARMATGAHPLNLFRARYLLPDWLLALYAGVATNERTPHWVSSIARAQFLDAMYARELVRALDGE